MWLWVGNIWEEGSKKLKKEIKMLMVGGREKVLVCTLTHLLLHTLKNYRIKLKNVLVE